MEFLKREWTLRVTRAMEVCMRGYVGKSGMLDTAQPMTAWSPVKSRLHEGSTYD